MMIISAVGVATIIGLALCGSGKWADYFNALSKCMKCDHYKGCDQKQKCIYCFLQGLPVYPDQAAECKDFSDSEDYHLRNELIRLFDDFGKEPSDMVINHVVHGLHDKFEIRKRKFSRAGQVRKGEQCE